MQQFTHPVGIAPKKGRITSLHGFLLPPKKIVIAKKYVTFRFAIQGTIPSKKNMIWAASNILLIVGKLTACKTVSETIACIKEHFKAYVKNSGKYNEWMQQIKPTIIDQLNVECNKHGFEGWYQPFERVSVKIYHYWVDDIERDLDNKQSTIYDMLKNCNIIKNDNWQCLRKIHSECENYKGEMLQAITTVDVTCMYF
jgi:hypothetical protein